MIELRTSTSTATPPTEVLDPAAPSSSILTAREFAPIRADLARLFHRVQGVDFIEARS